MKRLFHYSLAICSMSPSLLWAQTPIPNAVIDAEDAFGSSDGTETLGIYQPTDIRGFSAIDAGNVRIEGLYFDRQGDLGPRLTEGNRIRVGPSAQAYAFPAPSGIVDYRLRTPGAKARIGVSVQANSFGGGLYELDGQLPLAGETLGIGLGISQTHNEYASGNNADLFNVALTGVWRPNGLTIVKPFWARMRIVDEDIYPIIIADGVRVPDRMNRRRFVGQYWADVETERFNYGVAARSRIGDVNTRLGLFRSSNHILETHSVLLNAAPIGAPAARTVIGSPPRFSASTSGEFALSQSFGSDAFRQDWLFMVRGRSQHRTYGGADRVSIGDAPFNTPHFVTRPAFNHGAQSDDRVRQFTYGLGYIGRFADIGQINIGIQRSHYRKAIVTPSARLPVSHDKPWLFNVATTANVSPGLSLYASVTRGLEESKVAPDIAVNRDEAPPAILTRQIDSGLRLRLSGMTVIAGLFDIEKPYYGLDAVNQFRNLGTVVHRGAEFSVSGSLAKGVTLVTGGVLLDARVTGEEVRSGKIGAEPIDAPDYLVSTNIDWQPVTSAAFSFDAEIVRRGPSWGDTRNQVRVAGYTTVNLGLRYRFRIASNASVLRVRVTNALNSYGWTISGNNAFVYTQSRQVIARLTTDL